MESEEIWKDIPGFEDELQISDRGRVRRIFKPGISNQYRCVALPRNGKMYPYRIHSLVMQVFVGERPPGLVINHKNGIKTDNRLENLEYCTQAENMRHAREVLKSWGEPKPQPPNSGYGKLSADAVREIRRQVASGEKTQRALSILHGVCPGTISRVVNGKAWRDIE